MKTQEEIQKIAEDKWPVEMEAFRGGPEVDMSADRRKGLIEGYTLFQQDMKKEISKVLLKIYETRKEETNGAFREDIISGNRMLNEFKEIGITIESTF